MGTQTLEQLRQRRVELFTIAARRGVKGLRVFGSVARGEDTQASDIDFLVEMEPGRSLLDLAGLQEDLSKTLGRPVDVISERGIYPYLRDRILNEAVSL
jgi:predicted nucleotidyltransferase